MAGLFGYLAAGALQGVGNSIVEEAKARREEALRELEHGRLLAREDADRDFRRSERVAGQEFQKELAVGETKAKMIEAAGQRFRQLTPEEKTAAGLDPKKSYQIDGKGKISAIGGEGTTVNVDTGTIPAGYRAVRDGEGRIERIEPLPGSPAAAEADAATRAASVKDEQASQYADIVLTDIDRVKEKITSAPWYAPTAGLLGNWLKDVAGTRAADVQELTKGIRANIGFDRLQKMREASPTGGALGAITEKELSFLQATLGSLEQSQSEDQLLENLERLSQIYMTVAEKAAAYPDAGKYGFTKPPARRKTVIDGYTIEQVD